MTRLLAAALISLSATSSEWPQFRGPDGMGIGQVTKLPIQFGPNQKVAWKTDLPHGHSSPIIWGDRIFLTAAEGGTRTQLAPGRVIDEGGKLYTICVDRLTGKVLWKREAPRPRIEKYQPTNSAASPSPVTDGKNVYVFFGDFGVVSYSLEGTERWKLPLGPLTIQTATAPRRFSLTISSFCCAIRTQTHISSRSIRRPAA